MRLTIALGSLNRVAKLFSWPNSKSTNWTVSRTVEHWLTMTLDRDGLIDKGATLSVRTRGRLVLLIFKGPDSLADSFREYAVRLPRFLRNGWQALTTVIPKIQSSGRWDPDPAKPQPGKPLYQPWRFFLPLGMAMLNQKAVLFFHYPPIRLLETNQDYLNDPVPVRCEELLTANGVRHDDLPLFNTVMDATPIGAEDDQGSKKSSLGDPHWGLIPIQEFHEYQRQQVRLLLNRSKTVQGYTAPIVVFGAHPLETFNTLYGTTLQNGQAGVARILPGMKTPILASTHPYVFYGKAQGFDQIGSGVLVDAKVATVQMQTDLAVAGWLKLMAADPSQDPVKVLSEQTQFWNSASQSNVVNELVVHQGSLRYSDPATLAFSFDKPLPPDFGKSYG